MNREVSTIGEKSRAEDFDLLQQIDLSAVPKHVAIIMDGNGRWARARSVPRIEGHRAGVKAVDEVVTCAREIGIKVLTLYAFSMENWQRPKEEIRALMYLLKEYILRKISVMKANHIRFMTIGRIQELPKDVQPLLKRAEEETRENHGLILNLALSYGGRAEIVDAIRSILQDFSENRIRIDQVDEALVASRLYTAGLPDPDIMIRTSGEQRISNFLSWQSVYTELYFTPIWWPDFRRRAFLEAMIDFQRRERRFGLTGEQVKTIKGKEDAF
ncbi:MAG: isoprenyl transferase [Nitrospirae bacterium CG_4_9_14_3_um_filter_53_35]|nr:MAG: di-trans,poly-cis-decaprenylcistransferase [Nitrospirae bacterium CG2_30_53_67]PIS38364.1 MAG: isoprenyl transferase [Nitrospirae bacterium CG08_land_8_20_14_0_20_52_24]PIV82631.1 MAG: isoprenyl transferase [Nitrospirae bacterium CG17_big_fil_post_rev_8_21_14_2_50_50_9]PIW84325.1 MAG: isoprenyl transferase [Nitrospirae bacterium CG_4_8_14_3_um_filter_50_41]PIX86012.1 MAG: isoprenyl transferase [Nitrospirae bacterium CG_4_10_14_3_um_filter_53_41]PJA73066.1 MAG: isoprenyl transferase [Ni